MLTPCAQPRCHATSHQRPYIVKHCNRRTNPNHRHVRQALTRRRPPSRRRCLISANFTARKPSLPHRHAAKVLFPSVCNASSFAAVTSAVQRRFSSLSLPCFSLW
ncbi:hypothetical protein E2542_SST08083 [Spatholobus suberectus]|nr:hypothetical protein E2542_SST08083 [Spatholobus suberectus]